MNIDLGGRVAVVTGASRGIGRAIALELAGFGAKVVVNYNRNSQAADEVVAAIEASGGEALAVRGDVAVAAMAQGLIDAAVSSLGRIDILVNNAGTTRDNLLVRMSEEDWDTVLDINLKGAFNCTRSVTKTMMKQRYGRIINVTSVSGLSGNAGQANYSAAKAGLIGLTKSVAKELGSRNITVNAIAPGFVETDLTGVLGNQMIENILSMTPLGRLGNPEDIAHAVAFLVSDEASFITGQVLSVDGGLVMQ
jgi:3-oxoacyl-[acyl-carrier protein] reductase